MPATSETLLVVIHPAHNHHLALERAKLSASIREVKPHIRLFISPDVELMTKSERIAGVGMDDSELQDIFNDLSANSLEFSYTFCWTRDIENAIVREAEECNAAMVLYPFEGKAVRKHQWFTSAKWELLRNSTCPVMLVKKQAQEPRQHILAAVNFQSPYSEYSELNKRIIERGQWLAKSYKAKLTIVNAYEDMSDYPDVEKIMNISGLGREDIQIETGSADDVVAEVGSMLGVDLVLIGTRNTHDIATLYRGNTAEKVAAKVGSDVMVVT